MNFRTYNRYVSYKAAPPVPRLMGAADRKVLQVGIRTRSGPVMRPVISKQTNEHLARSSQEEHWQRRLLGSTGKRNPQETNCRDWRSQVLASRMTFPQFAGIKTVEVLRTAGRVTSLENRSHTVVEGNAGYLKSSVAPAFTVHLQGDDGQRFYANFNSPVNTLAGHDACVLWYRFAASEDWRPFAFADWDYNDGFVDFEKIAWKEPTSSCAFGCLVPFGYVVAFVILTWTSVSGFGALLGGKWGEFQQSLLYSIPALFVFFLCFKSEGGEAAQKQRLKDRIMAAAKQTMWRN